MGMLLAMMNVVTGVFVESVVEHAKVDRDTYLLNLVKTLFGRNTSEHGGMVSWEEFEDKLDDKYMQEFFMAIDVDLREAKTVFRLIDVDGSGSLDLEEFMNGCLRLRGPARALDLTMLLNEFRRSCRRNVSISQQLESVIDGQANVLKTLTQLKGLINSSPSERGEYVSPSSSGGPHRSSS